MLQIRHGLVHPRLEIGFDVVDGIETLVARSSLCFSFHSGGLRKTGTKINSRRRQPADNRIIPRGTCQPIRNGELVAMHAEAPAILRRSSWICVRTCGWS